jgi:2-polyprenyl-3-methyl-5-hydroxy-6-metoxy-1,4-benzoquinol methylase
VYCHRVIQHTPDPEQTLRHILDFVKSDGAVFVHSYAHTFYNLFCWKYFIRPATRRLNPESLYKIIKAYAKPAYHFTNFTYRFGHVGKRFNFVFVPFYNNRNAKKFEDKDDEFIIEFGIHDTFDALSPRYDQPLKASVMRAVAKEKLSQPFEVAEFAGITLLRSIVEAK